MIHQISTDTFENALRILNKLRLENKNKWLFAVVVLPYEHPIEIKSFNTSIQILRKGGTRFPSTFDMSVTAWKKSINDALHYIVPINQFTPAATQDLIKSI
jgi:hypothetical protein